LLIKYILQILCVISSLKWQ